MLAGLRHTHATMYYAKTRNAKGLQERLGHSDIQTTLNAYVHPTAEDILTDWKKASESFDLGKHRIIGQKRAADIRQRKNVSFYLIVSVLWHDNQAVKPRLPAR